MAQTKGKYWLANNPNAEIEDDEVKELALISETEFGILNDITASGAEINLIDGSAVGTAVASKAVIYSADKGITLGDTSQAAGVFTAKINTGVLNHATVFTTPAPAASVATGAHTLTAANLANGFVIQTSNHATSSTTTLPQQAVFVALFGDQAAVGDTFIWYLNNAATTVNNNLVLTQSADAAGTIVGREEVAANSGDEETATAGGTSTAMWMTRLTNVDGTTVTYRLS